MKRRTMLAASATAVTTAALAGCGGGGGAGNDSNTIEFAIHVANPSEQEPAFAAVVEAFQKANPDVTVNLTGKEQSEHIRSIKMQSQSGKLPDMFWILRASAEELHEAGALLDLATFLKEHADLAGALRPNMVDAFTAGDAQYGLPYQPLVTGFFCNEALFEQHGLGLPSTYEDLEAAARVFAQNGVITIAQGAKDPYSVWAFLTMLSRYGYFDRIDKILEGSDSFNNPDFLKFYEKIDSLRAAGAFPPNVTTQSYFQAVESFIGGKAALLDSGTWDTKKIEESAVGATTGFWWGPAFSDGVGEQAISSVVASAPIVVNAAVADDDAKLDAVQRFLAFYYGSEGIQIMVDNQIPPMTTAAVEVDPAAHPVFASVMEQVGSTDFTSQKAQPDLVVSEAVASAMYDSINGVINGTYTPQQALDVVQKAIDNDRG